MSAPPTSDRMSVIVPMYQAEDTIGDLLASLADQTYEGDWEIIVADNRSTDRGPAIARTWTGRLPQLRVVEAPERQGPAYARNVGAREATGALLVYCDADDVVDPGWLAALARTAAGAPLVGSRLEDRSDGPAPAWTKSDQPWWRGRRIPFLPWVPSAGFAIRAEVLAEIGGWDESYRYPAGEDIELCWKAQLAGHALEFADDAVVLKRSRGGARDLTRQQFVYGMTAARLYRSYRHRGARRRPAREVLHSTTWLVSRIPLLFGGADRRVGWIEAAAGQLGRLWGSLRFRVWYP